MSKVVSIFEAKEKLNKDKKDDQPKQSEQDRQTVEEMFRDIIERNMRNKDRMQNERGTKNKSVLRSYRIKS